MAKDTEYKAILNNQSYAPPTQYNPLTIEDIQRVFDDIKKDYENNIEKHYIPRSPVIIDEPSDTKNVLAWFKENFAHRMNAEYSKPLYIASVIYGEKGGNANNGSL